MLATSTNSTIMTRLRRPTFRVRCASGALVSTTVNANTLTVNPIRASVTPSSALMYESSPVGSISMVTLRNTASATVTSAR